MGGVAEVQRALCSVWHRPDSPVDLCAILATNSTNDRPPEGHRPALIAAPPSVSAAHAYPALLAKTKPDLVVFHHVGHAWARTHARTSEIPAIGVIHSWHQVTSRSGPERSIHAARVADTLPKLSAVVFPSQYVMHEGLALGFTYPAWRTIQNPLNEWFTRSPSCRRDPSGPIAFVGSLIPRKRPEFAIALARHLGRRIRIAGAGGPASWEDADMIDFRGALDSAEIPAFLEGCSMLCVPSTSESFGVAYLEAAACGVPSIGFAPVIEEINVFLGVEIGMTLAADAGLEELVVVGRTLLDRSWPAEAMSSATCARLAAGAVAEEYVDFFAKVAGGL